MRDAIVVGAGIIGSTISKALELQGMDVLLLDDNMPFSGTVPSGGHLKPSWFGGMKKTEYEPAMELLAEVWGLIEQQFIIYPNRKKETVFRVDTDNVIKTPYTRAKVWGVLVDEAEPIVRYMTPLNNRMTEEPCRFLVVAAGIWTNLLFTDIAVTAKQGVSFRLPGTLKSPFIKPWAPYKQVVAHQQGDGEIWAGDGTAILPTNWKDEQTAKCLLRCNNATGRLESQPIKTLVGYRPYCKTGGEPCLIQQVGPRAWAVTGSGKLGTIAAGWSALRMLDESQC